MSTYKDMMNALSKNNGMRLLSDKELEQIKKVMFQCYLDVKSVCEQSGISVILGGGSALGAVRHKDFIPWDDDFDILMTRGDFERFKHIFEEKLGDKYILNAPNYSKRPLDRFPRILVKGTTFVEIGDEYDEEVSKIKIDIFILENVPNNKIVRNIKGFWCTCLMFITGRVGTYKERNNKLYRDYMCQTSEGKKMFERRVRQGWFFSFIPYENWCNMVDKSCQYDKKTDYLGIPTGRMHYFGEISEKNTYLPPSQGAFRGETVDLPGDYDKYLRNLYKDYMVIPPENKRERHFIVDIKF